MQEFCFTTMSGATTRVRVDADTYGALAYASGRDFSNALDWHDDYFDRGLCAYETAIREQRAVTRRRKGQHGKIAIAYV